MKPSSEFSLPARSYDYYSNKVLFAVLNSVRTWILHESEVFICKALKGEVVVCYFEPFITQQMEASGSPAG